MRWITKSVLSVAVMLSVAGCSLPRSAAVEQEVVSQGFTQSPTFQVVEVNRTASRQINAWPASSRVPQTTWFKTDRAPDSAIIQTGDQLDVVVWDNQPNSLLTSASPQTPVAPLVVSPAGTIFFPYVGDIPVRGLTAEAARSYIQKEMQKVIPSVQLQLLHTPGRNNSVDVASGVVRAGRYPLQSRDTHILSVLSVAGGVIPGVTRPRVRLQRNGQVFETRLESILQDPSMNVRVRGGDQIAIVQDTRTYTVLGASRSQNLIPFPKENVSAVEAISSAGGLLSNRANPRGVLVLREYHPRDLTPGPSGPDMQFVVFTLDLTSADGLFAASSFQIQPNDTVLATESPITAVQTIVGLFGTLVGVGVNLDRVLPSGGDDN